MLQHRRQSAFAPPTQRPTFRTARIPQAPRAMVQTGNPASESSLENIRQIETKKLYPSLVLFGALKKFKDKEKPRQRSANATCEARRDFLDSFSYLCDARAGGGTVTAAALQKLLKSDFLWLAANEGVSDTILDYAKTIMGRLKLVTLENQSATKESIFSLAVDKCAHRIQYYKDKVEKLAQKCRMALRSRERNEIVISLRQKLRKLQPPSGMTAEGCINFCYDMRVVEIDQIKDFSSAGGDDFADLSHYIYRLGATRAAANTVVESMLTVSSLRRISEIRRVNAPPIIEVDKTLDPSCISPYEVLHSIIADADSDNPVESQRAFMRIHGIETSTNRQLYRAMEAEQTIVTRVHAELQIADTFSRAAAHMDFVDNDKYIGCSKPACYFCYNWLCEHRHRYILPATHYKILQGCRGPDGSLNEAGADVLSNMYTKIGKRIGQDVLEFLNADTDDGGMSRRQYMSTGPSSRVGSSVSIMRDVT